MASRGDGLNIYDGGSFDPEFLSWLYQCPVSFIQLLWMEYVKHRCQLADEITDDEIRKLNQQLRRNGLKGIDKMPPKA